LRTERNISSAKKSLKKSEADRKRNQTTSKNDLGTSLLSDAKQE
jgi:hypothetical protein